MKENKIYRGYHHEDLTLKFLKENTAKYIAKITNAEVSDEINVELINLKPKVLRIDYGIKEKDKIIIYEFLSTKTNIANILRRIFLYVARIGYDYQLKVKINLVITPEIDKNNIFLEYSPGQFFRPEVISFKDYDGDKLLSNITYKIKNNIKLTYNEFLTLGILPLHEPGVQVVKTLEIARKITDIDDELKDSVLGMLIVLADKFIDNQDLKNKVIDVIKMEITILHDYVTSHEQKWLEEGKLEGKVEGKEEGKLEIAKNMQKENYPIKEIAKITKLDCKTIEKLK